MPDRPNHPAYEGGFLIEYKDNIEVGTGKVIVSPRDPKNSIYYGTQTVTFQIVDKNNPNPQPLPPPPEPEPPKPTPTPTPPSVSIQSVSISGLSDSYNDGDNIQLTAKPVFSDSSTHSGVDYT